VRSTARGTVTLTIYNMSITFYEGSAVAFKRGDVNRRLVTTQPSDVGVPWRSHSVSKVLRASEPISPARFEQELYDNMKAAIRQIDFSYDIVAESKWYADIVMKAIEQLETIESNEWTDPQRLRSAVAETRMFLLERLAGLIKKNNDKVHFDSLTEIHSQQLKDMIESGRMPPPEESHE
jgi:hypothetical protein